MSPFNLADLIIPRIWSTLHSETTFNTRSLCKSIVPQVWHVVNKFITKNVQSLSLSSKGVFKISRQISSDWIWWGLQEVRYFTRVPNSLSTKSWTRVREILYQKPYSRCWLRFTDVYQVGSKEQSGFIWMFVSHLGRWVGGLRNKRGSDSSNTLVLHFWANWIHW